MDLVFSSDVEGRVNPAVVVQHFTLYPAARLTVDRVSEILLGDAYDNTTSGIIILYPCPDL